MSRGSGEPGRARRSPLAAKAASIAILAVVLTACGGASRAREHAGPLPASYIPLTIGRGRLYAPKAPPRSSESSIDDLRCSPRLGSRIGVHVELFANRHVVLIAPGIGVVGGVRVGADVERGRCFFPLVTLEPTGVVEVREQAGPVTRRPLTLGDLFALWGQALSETRLAGFDGHPVHAFVDGRRVPGDPADIRLRRHDEIVLETSGYVVPHPAYGFADGL